MIQEDIKPKRGRPKGSTKKEIPLFKKETGKRGRPKKIILEEIKVPEFSQDEEMQRVRERGLLIESQKNKLSLVSLALEMGGTSFEPCPIDYPTRYQLAKEIRGIA